MLELQVPDMLKGTEVGIRVTGRNPDYARLTVGFFPSGLLTLDGQPDRAFQFDRQFVVEFDITTSPYTLPVPTGNVSLYVLTNDAGGQPPIVTITGVWYITDAPEVLAVGLRGTRIAFQGRS